MKPLKIVHQEQLTCEMWPWIPWELHARTRPSRHELLTMKLVNLVTRNKTRTRPSESATLNLVVIIHTLRYVRDSTKWIHRQLNLLRNHKHQILVSRENYVRVDAARGRTGFLTEVPVSIVIRGQVSAWVALRTLISDSLPRFHVLCISVLHLEHGMVVTPQSPVSL